MPSNWLYIDTNFPSFTQKESTSDKIETMQDYLYMLVEQLRYTLHNLDLSNMNKAATDEFVKTITEPICARIEDAEGNLTQLSITVSGLNARISDAEGNITQLGATAKGLAARMENAEGDITQLTATAKGLSASITNLDGAITSMKADVNGIRATVSTKIDATQAQSIFDQSATGFTLGATSGESGTVFELNYNGVQVASTGSVDLHVDAVNVYGTLTAEELEGDTIMVRGSGGSACGYIYTDDAVSAEYKMRLESEAMEIDATNGDLFLSGQGGWSALRLSTAYVDCMGDFIPNSDDRYDMGAPNFVWRNVYCGTNELNGSDRKIKNSIETLPEKYTKMLELVKPRRYKLNDGTSGRYHAGFIAQEVEAAMRNCGIDAQEFAGWAKARREDGSETYFLRYSEFIPILWAKVREQEERLKRLEGSA